MQNKESKGQTNKKKGTIATLNAHLDLGDNGGEATLGRCQLVVGVLQGASLGLHVAVNLVVTDDVDDPRTQA